MTQEQDKNIKRDNFKNALCYIPFVSVIFFFTETNRDKEFNKNIKYGMFLLIAYILLSFFLGWLFQGILVLLYLGISIFLGYKAYNGDKIVIDVFDTIEESMNKKIDENKSKKTD